MDNKEAKRLRLKAIIYGDEAVEIQEVSDSIIDSISRLNSFAQTEETAAGFLPPILDVIPLQAPETDVDWMFE